MVGGGTGYLLQKAGNSELALPCAPSPLLRVCAGTRALVHTVYRGLWLLISCLCTLVSAASCDCGGLQTTGTQQQQMPPGARFLNAGFRPREGSIAQELGVKMGFVFCFGVFLTSLLPLYTCRC